MRASALILTAFLATYPFHAAHPQSATGVGVGVGNAQSSSSSTSFGGGQGGQGGQGGNGNANSALTINNQAQPSSLTTDGRLRTDGTLDQVITSRGGTSSVITQRGTQGVRTVPSTFAPGLTAAGVETCLGSISGGGSFLGGGISFGTTLKDSGCDARLDARTLWSMNLKRAAIFRLCQKDEIRAAMPDVCPQPQQPGAFPASAPLLASAPGGAPAFEPSPVVARGQPVMVIHRASGRERECADFDGRRCLRWSR